MAGSVLPGERIREETHVSQFLRLDSYIWQRTVALPLLLATLIWAGSAPSHATSDNLADLVENLLPTVVNIATTQTVESNRGEEFEEFFRQNLGDRRRQRRLAMINVTYRAYVTMRFGPLKFRLSHCLNPTSLSFHQVVSYGPQSPLLQGPGLFSTAFPPCERKIAQIWSG